MAFLSAKDIPGDNSFMPMNAGIVGITENELIFVPIDSEVEYFGQPCGIIVAKTMALANSVATKVEITYEKTQINRSIIPSLRHFRENNKLSACNDTYEHKIPANQKLALPLVGEEKKIKGKLKDKKKTTIFIFLKIIFLF